MDRITVQARSNNMRAIRHKGMKPEMAVRRLLHGMGYRYRLHVSGVPGRPDVVFGGRRKVIFVHGCFWHQHEDRRCCIVRKPKSNTAYWVPKLAGNVERDRENQKKLEKAGWKVMVIWECEVGGADELEERLRKFLNV